jgi:hypothetical protein
MKLNLNYSLELFRICALVIEEGCEFARNAEAREASLQLDSREIILDWSESQILKTSRWS